MINREDIERLVNDGFITAKPHPKHKNLVLCKYTREYQYANKWKEYWSPIVAMCRGLVFDLEADKIVARPFPKFFNSFEWKNQRSLHAGFTKDWYAFEKLDGSCITVFRYKGEWMFSTLGSWSSPQAQKAKEIFDAKYSRLYDIMSPLVTFMFEVIYPENRIVLNYGQDERMVFTGALITETGEDVTVKIGGKMFSDKAQSFLGDLESILKTEEDAKMIEGYVVLFEDGTRVKYKTDEYFAAHRIRSQLTPKSITESIKEGTFRLDSVQEEDREYVEKVFRNVHELKARFEKDVRRLVPTGWARCNSRKVLAAYIGRNAPNRFVRGGAFSSLDGKSYEKSQWKYVFNELKKVV